MGAGCPHPPRLTRSSGPADRPSGPPSRHGRRGLMHCSAATWPTDGPCWAPCRRPRPPRGSP
eukprot:13844613-Alexandrium_andersonii.AAC.1